MTLQELTRETLKRVGIPATVFARRLGISNQTISKWYKNELKISEALQNRIQMHVEVLVRTADELDKLSIF